MLTTTVSDFRKDLKNHLDKVTSDHKTLIIHRGNEMGVVVMSLDEYNSLCATQHELSSRSNEQRLDSAIEKLKKGQGFQRKLFCNEIHFRHGIVGRLSLLAANR